MRRVESFAQASPFILLLACACSSPNSSPNSGSLASDTAEDEVEDFADMSSADAQDGCAFHLDAHEVSEETNLTSSDCEVDQDCGLCDDDNPCTFDKYENGKCVFKPNDFAACTTGSSECPVGECVQAKCVARANLVCYIQCETGACDSAGACKPWVIQPIQQCADSDSCTEDACIEGECHHEITVCDDGNSCTSDACNSKSGCVHVNLPDGVVCDCDHACSGGRCQ